MNYKLFKWSWFNPISLALIFMHILTLNVSPIAWFDEVFLMDVTTTFLENGTFSLPMAPTYDREVLAYGPIYFFFTGLSLKLFGLGLIQFRLVNLLFGVLSVFILKKILTKHYKLDIFIANMLALLLFMHSIYHSNLHSGRMDLVALFFVLAGIFVFLSKGRKYPYVVGVLFALAVLTTPRVSVLLIGVPVFLVFNLVQSHFSKNGFLVILKIGLTALVLYSCWFFYAFGSINEFIDYYSGLTKYVGGSISLPFVMYPIIFLGVLAIGLLCYKKRSFKFALSPLFIIPFMAILAFHALVSITSEAYYALIIPFYVLVFGYWYKEIADIKLVVQIFMRKVNPVYTLLFAFISIYGFILVFKVGIICISYNQRNPSGIHAFIKENTQKESVVIGDYKYGYASKLNGLDFVSFEYNLDTKDQKSEFIKNVVLAESDYLMISNKVFKANYFIGQIIEAGDFKKIAEFETKETDVVQKIKTIIPIKFDNNYNGVLFKRQN